MKKILGFQIITNAIILISLLAGSVSAQVQPDSATQFVIVKGTVDSSYHPRAGVLISAQQSGKTTRTDGVGKYELLILRTDTLTFTYAGMPVRSYAFFQLTGDVALSFDLVTGEGKQVAIENDKGDAQTVDQNALPMFPWPVPQPSARYTLEDRYFATARTLSQVDKQLSAALQKSHYPSSSYYLIPNGFAMVNQIEQIEPDGAPKADPAERWSLQVQPLRKFDLGNYLRLLFTSATGHFRVVAFLVTNVMTPPSSSEPDLPTAKAWLNRGGDFLPEAIGRQPYGSGYHVTALIYEFQKPENGHARPVDPSKNSGQIHLTKSNFIPNLGR
ncbi:hypothetical protein [Larkinella sp.]|uniref:hypothetical protein n=1 Tax=Larkinella sp. TaxID=2034517 RepID=UPI003BAB9168